MAPTLEGQVEVDGLLMGPGTPYELNAFNPWVRNVRADHAGARPWSHGGWSGAEFRDIITVPLRIHIQGTSTSSWLSLHHALVAAFGPVGPAATDVEMRFIRGGQEFLMFGRPRLVEPDIQPGSMRSWSQCAFVGLDPHIYSGVEQVVSIGLPQFTGGLAVPFTAPVLVSARLSEGITTLTNEGIADTSLLLRIDGPVLEPRVVLKRPDGIVQTLSVSAELTAGQWLDIDTGAETVVLNGVADRLGDTDGAFPIAPPGTSTLRFFAADHEENALLTVKWRAAW